MESNLRDVIEFLVNLGDENSEPKVIEINGKTYCTKNLRKTTCWAANHGRTAAEALWGALEADGI